MVHNLQLSASNPEDNQIIPEMVINGKQVSYLSHRLSDVPHAWNPSRHCLCSRCSQLLQCMHWEAVIYCTSDQANFNPPTLLRCYSHELQCILTQDLLPDLQTCIRVFSHHPTFQLPPFILRFSSILATNPMNLCHCSTFQTALVFHLFLSVSVT